MQGDSDKKEGAQDIDVMMQKLPEVMKLITPVLSSGKKGVAEVDTSDKRSCLLTAIKPYLNPARCEAIDYMIKFSQLSEIIKQIN